MQIGVADPGGFQLHQGFTVAGGGQFEFGNLQRSDHPAQPGHFGAHRHHNEILVVQQHSEMIGAQPLRMAAQQHQYVGVPAGERGAPQLTVLVGDLPSGAIGTQNDEACRSRRRVVGLGSGQAQQGQVVLHRDDGCPNQRQRLRRGHPGSAGEVAGADQSPGVKIMHRYGRTTPRLDQPREVLRPTDLQFTIQGQRGARRVSSGAAFTPVGAGHEVHHLDLAARRAIAFHPQQRAVRGGDRHDDAGVGGIADQQSADDRERRRQRVNVSHPGHAQRHRGRLCSPAIGVHALGEAALPAFGHHAAQWSRVEVGGVHLAGDEEFVNGAQLRRRQSGRGPAARGSGYTHRRSRSSRPPLSAVAVDHISSTLRRDFTARTALIRSPEVLIGPEPEVRMG